MRVSLLLISFIPFALLADDPCLNIQYSEAVFLCSKKTFEDSDAKLNETYRTLLSTIRKKYNSQPNSGAKFIEKIKLSQRAWINFRDTNCTVFSFMIDEESQAYDTSMYSCKNDMTLKRTKELETILDNN
ncbi:TPA: DUF1311 domain-containing protein [Salmonella enterica subsp. enterica serovar Liverpool]|uniref:lysozyme inhibitor LprI family protein n=1 Tax=Salmonella enterica TaxID=28901 RepID=UPI00069C2543|nr:lysozyme inhibitor LprI family protein [Salmonella enterica]EAB9373899.1 DUF1311 domain-containing protein [Salmonella enterica subsp. enterica serovar Llandoff]EAW1937091.1 DUF1311 domain-containing protein [Salmonella enterica subsp. enterica]EBI0293232.1 DUF1311 domain-containing protein [Salmonella enterica subsp. enterica serovar Saintpaul]EBS0652304.1 DUF1311 domain-containing protein [Salmonella enterica subsp. enterica serovar Yolo]EBX9172548.1 DUF1311 domain-containing protein [Sal